MKKTILVLTALMAMSAFAVASNCASAPKADVSAAKVESSKDVNLDIVETAISADNFSTLVAAVKAADLVDALKGEGPFTVFAPSDEAFAKLPEGTLEALLADRKKLVEVLTYHVVEGDVSSEKVVSLDAAQTLNGQDVKISVKDSKVMINDAQVVVTDIKCSNGVIHVIDQVILPTMNAR